jgi:hypothetical protein
MRANGAVANKTSATARSHPVFSYQGREAYFRIVRRAGRWYVEYDGAVAGSFDSAQGAAEALADGRIRFDGLEADAGVDVPPDIDDWFRGDLERGARRHGPGGGALGCPCPPH